MGPRLLSSLLAAMAGQALGADLTLVVQVPASTPAGDTVYIAGDFQGWNPGSPAHALTDNADGTHQITLSLPDNQPIEFKFTRGDWSRVEKGPGGEEIPNRAHTPAGTQTLNLTVENWADINGNSTITGDVTTFSLPNFYNNRRVWIYLPPGYDASTDRYPVLYMHDGQNLFDDATSFSGEWGIDETCEQLITDGEIEPVIVVGIDNGGASRIFEYTPFVDPSFGGGGGDTYLQNVRDILVPHINATYRTRTGPENTFIAGSSLGGLISAYAGYAHADTWGRVGAFSPSYWYANQQMATFASLNGRPAGLERFYHDYGTGESQQGAFNSFNLVLLSQGFVAGDDFDSVLATGHQHNEFYWRLRAPDALRFLIDPARCAADVNADGVASPADFTAWLGCFNDPASAPFCGNADVNASGTIDPADFTAWLAAFNAGCD